MRLLASLHLSKSRFNKISVASLMLKPGILGNLIPLPAEDESKQGTLRSSQHATGLTRKVRSVLDHIVLYASPHSGLQTSLSIIEVSGNIVE